MKHLFIVNPVAGKGKGMAYIEEIKPLLEGRLDYHIEVTKGEGDATEIARAYTQKETCIVYAVGGDGTINEVVNGMVGTQSALAIVPTGSGNDFIRTIYPNCAKEELLYKLLKGRIETIDLVRINHKYFLNIASVGIDAEVVFNATEFKKMKYIKGDMAYIISIFKTLLKHKSVQLKIKIDGEFACDQKILLATVANGKFYGGGIQIAPEALVNDAKVDIYLVEDLKFLKILSVLPKLFRAKHHEIKEVKMYRAAEVAIESEQLFKLNIDGEITTTNQVEMQVMPQAIQVVVPA
ncbi:MAG: diacylglycerol/lipid kinase family protein [Cellulosilyticaceae bacterium]